MRHDRISKATAGQHAMMERKCSAARRKLCNCGTVRPGWKAIAGRHATVKNHYSGILCHGKKL